MFCCDISKSRVMFHPSRDMLHPSREMLHPSRDMLQGLHWNSLSEILAAIVDHDSRLARSSAGYFIIQYSTILCNTVQYSTTYKAVQHSTAQYSITFCNTIHYNILQCTTTFCNTITTDRYSTIFCRTLQYTILQYSKIQHYLVQCSTTLCSTVQYTILQYSTLYYTGWVSFPDDKQRYEMRMDQ